MIKISNKISLIHGKTEIEVIDEEKSCISKFLNGQKEKIIELDRLLGIGGEGLVLRNEIWTREFDYKTQLGRKEKKEVAMKFVKFEKKDEEEFDAPEVIDEMGVYGGIKEDGLFVYSKYFTKMEVDLGDFIAAAWVTGGYVGPYVDFGLSKVYGNYYFIID